MFSTVDKGGFGVLTLGRALGVVVESSGLLLVVGEGKSVCRGVL